MTADNDSGERCEQKDGDARQVVVQVRSKLIRLRRHAFAIRTYIRIVPRNLLCFGDNEIGNHRYYFLWSEFV